MSVIPKLASSLGRRDEVPNQELARHIAANADQKAVEELVYNLSNKKRTFSTIASKCFMK